MPDPALERTTFHTSLQVQACKNYIDEDYFWNLASFYSFVHPVWDCDECTSVIVTRALNSWAPSFATETRSRDIPARHVVCCQWQLGIALEKKNSVACIGTYMYITFLQCLYSHCFHASLLYLRLTIPQKVQENYWDVFRVTSPELASRTHVLPALDMKQTKTFLHLFRDNSGRPALVFRWVNEINAMVGCLTAILVLVFVGWRKGVVRWGAGQREVKWGWGSVQAISWLLTGDWQGVK